MNDLDGSLEEVARELPAAAPAAGARGLPGPDAPATPGLPGNAGAGRGTTGLGGTGQGHVVAVLSARVLLSVLSGAVGEQTAADRAIAGPG